MPLVYRTSQALLDLTEIALRIAEENPTAADRWIDSIDEKCQMLARASEIGRKRPDLAVDLRSFPVGKYVIFYRPVSDGVQIIRVLHGARDIPSLFE
jgi:toxin ParE1/3/4